jgi:hypothetical protein
MNNLVPNTHTIPQSPLNLSLESHGFSESDLEKEIHISDLNIPLHDIAVPLIYFLAFSAKTENMDSEANCQITGGYLLQEYRLLIPAYSVSH